MSKPTFLGPLIGKGAGQCTLVYAERGSVLASHVEPAFDSKTRKKGLLGRESIPDDYAMIIAPCSAVHTFSMRVPIDLVFVSRNGTITKTSRGVKPWRIAGSMGAHAVIEAAEGFINRHELVPGEIVALRETEHADRAVEGTPAVAPAPSAEPAAAHKRHTTRRRATLAELIARKTPLSWYNSLAVVQELCETVLARGPADDLRVPELKHIVLTADGTVTLLSEGPVGHSPVQRAGLVLLALTPEGQLPLQLRLLVLEEVSPRPRLNSLNDLHRELEFFERPDRQSIVREVYERFQTQSAQGPTESAVPAPLLEPRPPKRHHRWWRGRSVRAGSLAVLLTLGIAGAIWVWPRPEGQWLRANASHLSQVSQETARRAVKAVRSEAEAAKWNLGFRPRAPEPGVPVLAVAGQPASTPEPGQDIKLEGGVPPPAVPPFELPKAPLGVAPEPIGATPVSGGDLRVSSPEPAGGAVFSVADADVVPPKRVSPRTLPSLTEGTESQPAPEVELVVSAAGDVESVRVVSGQTSALSGMQISAIKAWRFTPATRNEQPVRYRLRILLRSR